MIHLDYRDAQPIYSQIIQGLCQQITAGVLQPGERLPSVRELAAQLAINPNTIQRAYRELEQAGWICSVAGKGCFVSIPADPRPEDQQTQQLLQTLETAAAALIQQGFTREELAQRILKGGNEHA